MNGRLKSHLALWIVAFIYGANYTIAKDVMPTYVKPYAFIFMRVIGALVLYWLTSLFLISEKIERKDYLRLFFCGMFGVSINQLLFFKGLNLTTPINASIMMVCTPILVLIISLVVLKEKINLIKIIGIALGLSGAIALITTSDSTTNSFQKSSPIGDLFILINALSWGIYLVLVKPLMQKYHTITVIKWAFLFGSILVIPIGYSEFLEINFSTLPLKTIGSILFVIIAVTYIAYILNTYALKNLSPTIVSIYIYLQPILATLIAILSKKDELSFYKLCAAILIFSGVYLVSFNSTIFLKK